MTRTEQAYVDEQIRESLSRKNLPHNHVLANVLKAEAKFAANGSLAIVAANGTGLDERIEQLRRHPSYQHTFPADPPKLAKTDMKKLSENFAKVATGEVTVE